MKRLLVAILLSLPLSAAAATISVVDSWPGRDQAVLTVEQHFWVHLRYQSPTPLRIWVRPYLAGESANAISHGATLLPAGSGESLGWFAMREPGTIDEYRVSYLEQNGDEEHHLLSVPVKLSWLAGQAQQIKQPEWIPRLQAEMDRLHKIEMANAPAPEWYWGFLAFGALLGVPAAAVTASWKALRRWDGIWALLGGAPLVVLMFWIAWIAIGVAIDPTSHNLFPFEILMWGGYTLGWLGLLWLAQKLRARPARHE